MDFRALSTKDTKQPTEDPPSYPRILKEPLLSTTKLIYENVTREPSEMNANEESTNPSFAAITIPSIVTSSDENDDDPPPYTAIAPPNHVGWPFDFSSSIPYSVRTETPCRAEAPLAPFQTSLTSGSSFHPEGADGQHTSISSSMPLMPCRILRFGSHRSLFMQRNLPFTDDVSATKDSSGRTRRYGAILVGAAVIVFLMVLSLMVRLVVEKSFWRS